MKLVDMQHFYSDEVVELLFNRGLAVDGLQGGLILGPSHEEDGIFVLQSTGAGYKVTCEVEGYEYLLSPAASFYFKGKIED